MSENEQEKRETLADIVTELRNRIGDMYDCTITTDEEEFHSYADRIEAAWKLEREDLELRVTRITREECRAEYCKTGGNAAAMREALVALRDAARDFCHQILNSKHNEIMDEYTCERQGFPAVIDIRDAIVKANAAISAPARQCDVGTEEEQTTRFRDAVIQNCGADEYCRCEDAASCFAKWAQTPYAQEGAGK